MIVPLHNHSDYSNLDGNALPVEIAARAKELGCPACAITDHGVVTGHLDFVKEMKAVDLKPILGIEAYHGLKWSGFKGQERDQAHLILLAQNDRGLRNLWRLVDGAADPARYRYVPRMGWDGLDRHNEGLICTSACALGLVVQQTVILGNYQPLNQYLDTFGDRFYIELHTYDHTSMFEDAGMTQADINIALVQIAQERGIPVVYANDAHYAFPGQYPYHDAYLAAATGKQKKGEPDQNVYTPVDQRKMWHPQCLYIMSEEEVRERLNYLPDNVVDEAIDNSVAIAESCNADLPEVKRHLPTFIPKDCPWVEDKYETAADLFVALVEKGIYDRFGEEPAPEIWDRAVREMEIFLDAGLEHYFLWGWDVCMFCDSEELPNEVQKWFEDPWEGPILRGPGRGSSAGCLVAYALKITDVDPLYYGLIFERFWNAGRAEGFPDIDSDFARRRRPEIVRYLKKRLGEKRVRPIGTTTRLKPKACIDRFYKACDILYDDKEELKKIVDQTPDIDILGPDSIAWSRESDPDLLHKGKARTIYIMDHVEKDVTEWVGKDKKRQFFVDVVGHVTNRVENYGIHPSGILLSDVDLDDEAPCDLRGPKEDRRPVTQFNMEEVDKRGFIKLDILGLKTLDTLDYWAKQIEAKL